MILQTWLEQLCLMIPNVKTAVVVDRLDELAGYEAAASWPDKHADTDTLFSTLPLLKSQLSPVVIMGNSAGENRSDKQNIEAGSTQTGNTETGSTENNHASTLVIAYPLTSGAEFSGAVIIEVAAKPAQQTVLLQILGWGQSWLRILLETDKSTLAPASNSQNPTNPSEQLQKRQADFNHTFPKYLNIIKAVLNTASSQEAFMTMVTEIAKHWHFDRVSIATVRGSALEVQAISHSAGFDARSNQVRSIEEAMEETLLRGDVLMFPGNETVVRAHNTAHQRLLADRKDFVLFSVPLSVSSAMLLPVSSSENGQTIAVLVCECQIPKGQSKESLTHYLDELKALAGLLAPLAVLQQRANQTIVETFGQGSTRFVKGLMQGRLGRLPLYAALVLVAALSGILQMDFRIAANSSLEGKIQRAVVAPFDGYIETALFRAGEQVQKGDVIAELDDKPLQLEKQGWLSQKEEYQKQYRQELASMNQAKARIIKTKIAQADAQIALVESRLQRARMVAPLSGIIIEGDLSRSLGAPVEQGQVLFEVAPLDEYRIVLKVHERDIAFLQKGQKGTLVLTAYPNEAIPLNIEHVAVVFEQGDNYSWYRTEASIDSEHLPETIILRPGMEGLGKIDVGRKSYAWIGMHRLIDWFRLWFWSWMP